MELRFGIGGRDHTLREIASLMNLTCERIRQIEIASLKILFNLDETQALRDANSPD